MIALKAPFKKVFLCFLKYKIIIFLFASTFIIYFLTSGGPTPYNYFVRLADAFLHGRLYLTETEPWLSELVPMGNKYYGYYPPIPALIILPFVFFKGLLFNQTFASILFGSLNSALIYLFFKKFYGNAKKSNVMALAISILFAFGTIHWYLASVGSTWYFAHVITVFFLLLALNELFGKKRPWLIGLLLGVAYWSRLPVILSFPFFLIILLSQKEGENQKSSIKNKFLQIFQFFLGLGFFVGLSFLYNYLRFGTIFDFGYMLVPERLNEPWNNKGFFNMAYIPAHLEILFLKGPVFLSVFPYLRPSWAGMAIWLTTPAFIFALIYTLRHFKEKIALACWSAIVPILFLIASQGGTGFTQFGYRYAMDFYPFLLILTAKGMTLKDSTPKWYHIILIALSIIINLWGVLWINKFGWVGW